MKRLKQSRRMVLTVSVTNINDYVGFAEKINAKELFEIMQKFYDEQSRIIDHHEGYIMDIKADNLLATWGIINEGSNHADMAVKSSLLQHREIENFNCWLNIKGFPPISIRIAINTASLLVGELKNGYLTVLGDGVNVATRLCRLAKELNKKILVSEFTAKYASPQGFKEVLHDYFKDLRIFEID